MLKVKDKWSWKGDFMLDIIGNLEGAHKDNEEPRFFSKEYL